MTCDCGEQMMIVAKKGNDLEVSLPKDVWLRRRQVVPCAMLQCLHFRLR